MIEDILAMIIPMVGFICLVAIIKIVTDNRVRRRLAETHATEDLVRSLMEADDRDRHESSLKWGIVAVSLGVGMTCVGLFDLKPEDPTTFGLITIAVGIGLITYYLISGKIRAQQK